MQIYAKIIKARADTTSREQTAACVSQPKLLLEVKSWYHCSCVLGLHSCHGLRFAIITLTVLAAK